MVANATSFFSLATLILNDLEELQWEFKRMGQIALKSHIPSKRYGHLFTIFSAMPLEPLSWNCSRNRRILQKNRWTKVFEFLVFSCEYMENKLVRKEDLKHFLTSLLGNEEDAKGLLNIKQEVLSRIYLIVASGFTWNKEIW